jgi:hypothetical protein
VLSTFLPAHVSAFADVRLTPCTRPARGVRRAEPAGICGSWRGNTRVRIIWHLLSPSKRREIAPKVIEMASILGPDAALEALCVTN